MSFAEIFGVSAGGLFVLLTLVQIAPIKINPWSWLARKVGSAINSQVIKDLADLKADEKELQDKLDEHIRIDNERDANLHRMRILSFNTDLMRGIDFTHEYFVDMLREIDEYEAYCAKHEEYKNNRAVMAIEYIRKCYQDRMRTGDFLGGV